MNPQKNNMSVLAQISSWIPDRIADNFAKKYKIQTRSFSPFSHVLAMVYAHLAHSLSRILIAIANKFATTPFESLPDAVVEMTAVWKLVLSHPTGKSNPPLE